jgi:hypothetical protein
MKGLLHRGTGTAHAAAAAAAAAGYFFRGSSHEEHWVFAKFRKRRQHVCLFVCSFVAADDQVYLLFV